MTDGRPYPPESHVILFPQVMGGTDGHGDRRANGCRQCRSRKSQLHREHKNVIKHNIKQTGRNCAGHGCGRSLIVSGKRGKRIICHKQWCSDQHDPEIAFSKGSQTRICAKKMQKFLWCKNTCDNKRHAAQNAPENGLEKIMIRVLTLGSVDPESGS